MLVDLRGAWGVHFVLLIFLKLTKCMTISCVVIRVCGVISGIFIQNLDKYMLIDISKMSPDLEIITMAASILEKSGFRLICLELMYFLVTQSL